MSSSLLFGDKKALHVPPHRIEVWRERSSLSENGMFFSSKNSDSVKVLSPGDSDGAIYASRSRISSELYVVRLRRISRAEHIHGGTPLSIGHGNSTENSGNFRHAPVEIENAHLRFRRTVHIGLSDQEMCVR